MLVAVQHGHALVVKEIARRVKYRLGSNDMNLALAKKKVSTPCKLLYSCHKNFTDSIPDEANPAYVLNEEAYFFSIKTMKLAFDFK